MSRKRKNDSTFDVNYNGAVHTIDVADITYAEEIAIRKAAGLSLAEYSQAKQLEYVPEIIAGYIWATIRRTDTEVGYAEVLNSIGIASSEGDGDRVPPDRGAS